MSACTPAELCASLPLTVSCLIKVFLLLGGLHEYMLGSCIVHPLVLEIDVYWLLEKGKRLVWSLSLVILATKLILKVHVKLSPDRSMVHKAERRQARRSVQTGTKYCVYLSDCLPSFVI